MYKLYILRSTNNQLYIGLTSNLEERLKAHSSGRASQMTRSFVDFEFVYTEDFASLATAMAREKQCKGWTRAKKEALITGDLNLLKRL
jgi:predicted GIY-YIG superfamily endonuclease